MERRLLQLKHEIDAGATESGEPEDSHQRPWTPTSAIEEASIVESEWGQGMRTLVLLSTDASAVA